MIADIQPRTELISQMRLARVRSVGNRMRSVNSPRSSKQPRIVPANNPDETGGV